MPGVIPSVGARGAPAAAGRATGLPMSQPARPRFRRWSRAAMVTSASRLGFRLARRLLRALLAEKEGSMNVEPRLGSVVAAVASCAVVTLAASHEVHAERLQIAADLTSSFGTGQVSELAAPSIGGSA